MQHRQPTASACLKELRLRFEKGLGLIYFSKKELRWSRVPDGFVRFLCALTDTIEGRSGWEGAWHEE